MKHNSKVIQMNNHQNRKRADRTMAQYAIAFDLDTRAMDADGLTQSDKTRIYQTEIPNALEQCGFDVHAQGSLYHTSVKANDESGAIIAVMNLKSTVTQYAPSFIKYAKCIHVFRMDEWSDVTELLTGRKSTQITTEDVIEQTKVMQA